MKKGVVRLLFPLSARLPDGDVGGTDLGIFRPKAEPHDSRDDKSVFRSGYPDGLHVARPVFVFYAPGIDDVVVYLGLVTRRQEREGECIGEVLAEVVGIYR